jgi:predicted esterase
LQALLARLFLGCLLASFATAARPHHAVARGKKASKRAAPGKRAPKRAPIKSAARPAAPSGPCAAGAEVLGDGACLFRPRSKAKTIPLVLYLHGTYGPEQRADQLQEEQRIANRVLAAGLALLVPRGRKGSCEGGAEHLCWPSVSGHAETAKEIVASWKPMLDKVGARVGREGKRFIFGYDTGALFAAMLLEKYLLIADAFAIVHGGSSEDGPIPPRGHTPLLLVMAQGDQRYLPMMKLLHDRLTSTSWPHTLHERAGKHELTDSDIDVVVSFFRDLAR